MNRSAVLPVSLLTILICIVAVQVVDAGTHMHLIHVSGIIKAKTEEFRIGKHLLPWGNWNPTTEQIEWVASHFDVVNVGYEANHAALAKLKQLNPNIIIIIYIDAVSSLNSLFDAYRPFPESDYTHDDNGNRIRGKTWTFEVMNPASTHWRQVWAEVARGVCDGVGVDGIFADDVWSGLYSGKFQGDPPLNNAKATWYNDMKGFLNYVKGQLGSYLLIPNTPDNGGLVDVCDGKWEEGFVHARWQSYGSYLSLDGWKKKIDGVRTVCEKGKMELVSGGCSQLERDRTWTQGHLTEVQQLLGFCFSSYLLGMSGSRSGFNFGTYWNRDDSHGYYSIFDDAEQLGSPINNYYSFQSVYARDFENGKVLANPASSSYTISLGENYRTLDGQTVSSVTLDGHTGVILLKP